MELLTVKDLINIKSYLKTVSCIDFIINGIDDKYVLDFKLNKQIYLYVPEYVSLFSKTKIQQLYIGYCVYKNIIQVARNVHNIYSYLQSLKRILSPDVYEVVKFYTCPYTLDTNVYLDYLSNNFKIDKLTLIYNIIQRKAQNHKYLDILNHIFILCFNEVEIYYLWELYIKDEAFINLIFKNLIKLSADEFTKQNIRYIILLEITYDIIAFDINIIDEQQRMIECAKKLQKYFENELINEIVYTRLICKCNLTNKTFIKKAYDTQDAVIFDIINRHLFKL